MSDDLTMQLRSGQMIEARHGNDALAFLLGKAADELDGKDAEIADLKKYAAEQDSFYACPICHSINVEQTHPAGAGDFGAFKCHDCGHQGEIGEDFPTGTKLRARIAELENEIERRNLYRGSDGCSTGDCPHDSVHECTAAQGEIIQEQSAFIDKLEADLAEARGVVERLPKTADGVRVGPGSLVYVDLNDTPRWSIFGIGTLTIEGWDTRSEAAVFRNTPVGNKPGEIEEIFFAIEDCYSTPEAAEAAASGGGG